MVATSLAQLRSGVATRIAGLGAPWWRATIPFDRLGASAVPDHVPDTKAHGAFGIGVARTAGFADRQTSDGTLGTTELVIRFLARAKPAAAATVAAEDAALDMEHALIKRLMARVGASSSTEAWPGLLLSSLVLVSRSQACPAPHDWFVHEITFKAQHRLALA